MNFSDLHVNPGKSKPFFLPCMRKRTKMEMLMIDYIDHCQFCELCIIYNILG